MQIQDAVAIVRALVNGEHPFLKTKLEEGSLLHNAEVSSALTLALGALERLAEREQRADGRPQNAGKAWSNEEDTRLLEAFDNRATDNRATLSEIATLLNRSLSSVRARLERLGRLEEGEWP
jgi:hypothetical protein